MRAHVKNKEGNAVRKRGEWLLTDGEMQQRGAGEREREKTEGGGKRCEAEMTGRDEKRRDGGRA